MSQEPYVFAIIMYCVYCQRLIYLHIKRKQKKSSIKIGQNKTTPPEELPA